MGLSPLMLGPEEELWISPSDILRGKLVFLSPPTRKHVQALTHEAILEIGGKILDRFEYEKELEKQREILEAIIRTRFEEMLKCRELVQRTKMEAKEECDREQNILLEAFCETIKAAILEVKGQMEVTMLDLAYKELIHFEELMRENMSLAIRDALDELRDKMKDEEYHRMMTREFEFQHKMELQRVEFAQIMLKANVDHSRNLRRLLLLMESRHASKLVRCVAEERHRCHLELDALRLHLTTLLDSQQSLMDSKMEEIGALKKQCSDQRGELARWECKLRAVAAEFQSFVTFSFRAVAGQAQFLLSLQNMVETQLPQLMVQPRARFQGIDDSVYKEREEPASGREVDLIGTTVPTGHTGPLYWVQDDSVISIEESVASIHLPLVTQQVVPVPPRKQTFLVEMQGEALGFEVTGDLCRLKMRGAITGLRVRGDIHNLQLTGDTKGLRVENVPGWFDLVSDITSLDVVGDPNHFCILAERVGEELEPLGGLEPVVESASSSELSLLHYNPPRSEYSWVTVRTSSSEFKVTTGPFMQLPTTDKPLRYKSDPYLGPYSPRQSLSLVTCGSSYKTRYKVLAESTRPRALTTAVPPREPSFTGSDPVLPEPRPIEPLQEFQLVDTGDKCQRTQVIMRGPFIGPPEFDYGFQEVNERLSGTFQLTLTGDSTQYLALDSVLTQPENYPPLELRSSSLSLVEAGEEYYLARSYSPKVIPRTPSPEETLADPYFKDQPSLFSIVTAGSTSSTEFRVLGPSTTRPRSSSELIPQIDIPDYEQPPTLLNLTKADSDQLRILKLPSLLDSDSDTEEGEPQPVEPEGVTEAGMVDHTSTFSLVSIGSGSSEAMVITQHGQVQPASTQLREESFIPVVVSTESPPQQEPDWVQALPLDAMPFYVRGLEGERNIEHKQTLAEFHKARLASLLDTMHRHPSLAHIFLPHV